MMAMKKFQFRAFRVLIMFWSLIVETISGVILYIIPPGRTASWVNWKLFGFSKGQWEAIHTIFGYVFLIFACMHIVFQWRNITAYIRKKVKTGIKMRVEMITSLLVVLLVFICVISSFPPFQTVMDLGEKAKDSWGTARSEPMLSRAEKLSFKQFTERIGLSVEEALIILKKKGLEISDINLPVSIVAKKNNLAPVDIYDLLKAGLSNNPE